MSKTPRSPENWPHEQRGEIKPRDQKEDTVKALGRLAIRGPKK